MPKLDAILDSTRRGLPVLRARMADLERAANDRPAPPDFALALRRPAVALIAEVKRRSPSVGAINEALDPVVLADAYVAGGAAAISVLTDTPFFGGSMADLDAVVRSVKSPVLRKDFILDESQILEARAAGAAAVLLIVRALDDETLRRLLRFGIAWDLTPLVEAHSAAEVARALDAGATVIGVNARDLDNFSIDQSAAWRLLAGIPPDCIAVAESGMATVEDVAAAAVAGADAVLIGSALASASDPVGRARGLSEVPVVAVDAKICGLMRPDDAAFAAAHGAWRLGVVFANGPRVVTAEQARAIVAAAAGVPVLGVFGPQPLRTMLETVSEARLAGVQLHGDHAPGVARELRVRGLEVWNVVAVRAGIDLTDTLRVAAIDADALLIEAAAPGGSGGKGIALALDLARAARVAAPAVRFVLAGGLTADSVGEAIRVVGPDVVDVSSGVESSPGVKDRDRLARFLENVLAARPAA